MKRKRIYVVSGGTMVHVRPHFSLCAPAYGTIGVQLAEALTQKLRDRSLDVVPIFTKMARTSTRLTGQTSDIVKDLGDRGLHPETNEDLAALIRHLVSREDTRGIILPAAVCDWKPVAMLGSTSGADEDLFGKDHERLSTSDGEFSLRLAPTEKIVSSIRKERKDIFLVSFKTTAGKQAHETYTAGLTNLKKTSSNLVFANDITEEHNIVVTPEEYPYYCDTREDAVDLLAQMVADRTALDFVRTHVDPSDSHADLNTLHSERAIPMNFVPVLKHLIEKNAYKPFLGKTSGHFGCKVSGRPYRRISSERKVDHNEVFNRGVVKIYGYDEDGRIKAGATKPSVGEHTQQQIYDELPEADCIVHFHSPFREGIVPGTIPVREQAPYECGSIQCGQNTASGMKEVKPGIWAVHLRGHGPNIAFKSSVDPSEIISVIDQWWDPESAIGGVKHE